MGYVSFWIFQILNEWKSLYIKNKKDLISNEIVQEKFIFHFFGFQIKRAGFRIKAWGFQPAALWISGTGKKKKIKEQGRKMSKLLACLLLVLLEPPSDKTFRSKCCQLRKSSVRFWGKKIFFLLEKINIIQWRKEEKSGKEIRLPRRDFL